ncbi:MAG: ABC transporter ATP-binding protein [Pseudomonadota bacterium]|nr:ABC transporter ATP-binding protein [Pseudomonadota bacterium]
MSAPGTAAGQAGAPPPGDVNAVGLLRGLWPYLRADRARFGMALALTPIVAGLGLVQPLLLKSALDDHIVAGKGEGLWAVAAAFLAVVVLSFVFEAAYTLLLATAAENSILRLREALFRHTLGLSQRFFERQPTGQLMTRATSDVDALNEALTAGSISILLDVLVMGGTLVAMFLLDVRLTLLLLCVGLPLAGIIEFFRRRMRVLFGRVRDALAAMNGFLAERLAGIEVLQLYGQEERTEARMRALDTTHRDANVENNYYDAALYAIIDGLASVCIALMLAYGATRVGATGADAVSVGLVVAFVDYVDRLFRPLREFSGKVTFLQRAVAALDKIFWLLGVTERITPGDLAPIGSNPTGSIVSNPAGATGRLSLKDVRFRYRPDGPWVLDGISLDVSPGEVVAVVGRTGSGKSTLVRLIARVHDGYEGSITLDDVELSRIAPAAVRRIVGSVRQEVQLFTDTLRFNVTLGDPTLDPARVEEAISLSNASAIAMRHPEGLDHKVRDRGANLSAGEAQILALARTLARDPAIVVLDEATASVDPVTEQLLQQAIERVFVRKTCLVIAHRLSTVVHADRIVVMDAGRVIEQGTHAELLARAGSYAALFAEGFGEVEAAKEAR